MRLPTPRTRPARMTAHAMQRPEGVSDEIARSAQRMRCHAMTTGWLRPSTRRWTSAGLRTE